MRHSVVVLALVALGSVGCTARDRGGDAGYGDPHRDGGPGSDAYFAPVDMDIVTPSAPSDAASMFGGTPEPSHAPSLVYPLDQVVVPPNLSQLEFHYLPNGGTVFQLSVTAGASHIRVYFGCPETVGAGCVYMPDFSTWTVLSSAARGHGTITYVLRGVDASGHLGETDARTITFTSEDVTGGLYYWTPGFMGAINRFEFGVPGAHAERFLSLGDTGAHMCVGCHELSRDGSRIAVGTDTPTTTFQVFDIATRTRQFMLTGHGTGGLGGPQQSNFTSWSPDDSQIVGSALTGLRFLSAVDGSLVEDHVTNAAASMPNWSPDGQHIVYVAYPGRSIAGLFDETGVASGSITRLDQVGGAWTVGPTLVPSMGDNNFHPSYSPDGAWVIYNRSASNISSLGEDPMGGTSRIADAALWVVSSEGGTPISMDTAHGLSDQWPRFNPTVFHDAGHDLYWMVWASRRAYGLRLDEDTRSQLWMAAFSPSRAAAGMDPTSVPFWVPFQDMTMANHLAQWVSTVERMACTTDADCGGEFCRDRRCFEMLPDPV
jgi:TolB protein